MKEIFIPECFKLEPGAVETINAVWQDVKYKNALEYLHKNFFSAEIPESADKLPWKGDELGKLLLTAAAAYYPHAVELYEKLQWPVELLYDTMLDFRVWSLHHKENYGTWGLSWDAATFIRCHLLGRIIRFGRLQCNTIYPLWKELVDPAGKWVLEKGMQVINLHIPAIGPMTPEECRKSMEKMQEFFRIYRPELDWRAFICHSWLLDPQLQELLPESSNIVQFQKLGTIIPEPEKVSDAVFRVFGVKAVNDGVDSVPWKSSMQKILGKFLLDGGVLHSAWMVIPRDRFK